MTTARAAVVLNLEAIRQMRGSKTDGLKLLCVVFGVRGLHELEYGRHGLYSGVTINDTFM